VPGQLTKELVLLFPVKWIGFAQVRLHKQLDFRGNGKAGERELVDPLLGGKIQNAADDFERVVDGAAFDSVSFAVRPLRAL
jgi:hypothetical protein